MPRNAFEVIKHNRAEYVLGKMAEQGAEMEKRFMDCWFSEGTRTLLRAAAKKF